MRVALLPTGRTEWLGLAQALRRLFPAHEFYVLPSEAEVASNPRGFPYPGFTSSVLTDAHETSPPESARELVARAAQEALGDRRKRAADLVIVVDDLELPNAHQADRVVAVMRRAVQAHLARLVRAGVQERTRGVLRDRVSFHLIAPMIEAWFFADPGALVTAGVPGSASVHFDGATDPEGFVTGDPAYLAATEADCPKLAALAPQARKKVRPKWLGSLPRERHPKGYLQWLCRDPADKSCTRYSETEHGGPTLAGIRWGVLLARPDVHFGFLRALLGDLEDGLACPSTNGPIRGQASALTARGSVPKAAVLRNL